MVTISLSVMFHYVFQLTIVCGPQGYTIMVNGQQVHTYKHRYGNLQEIDMLEVDGDLNLSSVTA